MIVKMMMIVYGYDDYVDDDDYDDNDNDGDDDDDDDVHYCHLALGNLGEAAGDPAGRGEEQEESCVPSFRNWGLEIYSFFSSFILFSIFSSLHSSDLKHFSHFLKSFSLAL